MSSNTYVRILPGSGIDSGQFGTVVDRSKVRTDGRGVPTSILGAYKPVDWNKEVAVRILELSSAGIEGGKLITMFKTRIRPITEEERALLGFLHHTRSTKTEYQSPRSLIHHVEVALSPSSGRNEQRKALRGILHHNDAVKEEFKLPNSLVRQVQAALGDSGGALDGVSPRTRKGVRVRFAPSPGSLVLYSHHPAVGEEGTTTTMPGFGSKTYLPGPGGGLLYVNWDNAGTIGVSPNDLKKVVRGEKLRVGVGRPGQRIERDDVVIETTLHPVKGFEGSRGSTPVWFVVRSEGGPVLAVYGANLHLEAQAKAREIEKQTGASVRVLQLHSRKRPTVGQHLDGVDVDIDDLDVFTRQYIETALWSSTDDDEEPLDANYGVEDLAPEALKRMVEDSQKFQRENWSEISGNLGRAGHDFWLTRNGHGAGFWDGDWPDPLGDVLTGASKKFGQQWIYVGDDGKLYVQ